MKIPIGIDLGTTYSCVAYVPEGADHAVMIENRAGHMLTPSAVTFTSGGGVEVGVDAKLAASVHPERSVQLIKRQMGTDHTLTFDSITYRPEGVSAIILRELVDGAAEALGVAPSSLVAVVTVPAYFGVREREATMAATRIAELECIDLVAEPVAAALAYGFRPVHAGTTLVYDLGGGTFDVTIIRYSEDGSPHVIAVDGSHRLGGADFDDRLSELLLERYVRITGDVDAESDDDFVTKLYAEAERAKCTLSRRENVSVRLQRGDVPSTSVSVSRVEFTAATADLMNETLGAVDRVIAAATAKGTPRPAQVVLVGGSSRMPFVRERIEEHLGVPARLADPDLSVANGAALHCALLMAARPRISGASTQATGRLAGVQPLHAVLPRALGIKIHDSHDPTGSRQFVQHLVRANTPLPVRGAMATFATILDGQERVRIELMEQAGAVASPELDANRRILDGELSGLPADLAAGTPIDLTLSVGLDGRIACVARERSSGRDLLLESFMEGVADGAEEAQQRSAVSSLRIGEN